MWFEYFRNADIYGLERSRMPSSLYVLQNEPYNHDTYDEAWVWIEFGN